MHIKLENNLVLTTYSNDCISIKKRNNVLISSKDILHLINWLNKNGFKELKNHVLPMLINFSDKDIELSANSFNTQNYSLGFDDKKEYTISDKSNRNNIRWIHNKRKMIERVYLLEINKLHSKSTTELVADIVQLNNDYKYQLELYIEKN